MTTTFSNILKHHGVEGMHWGVRNGPPYPLDKSPSALANDIHSVAKKKEIQITKDVKEAAAKAGSKMYGLEHKLKTLESIERKIKADAKEKNLKFIESANDIKDAVRYTTITDDNNFTNAYNKVKGNLITKGYKEERCKNYFDLYKKGIVKHKSVQSVFSDKDGYRFELQFQTPASQDAKNKKIPIYEERRKTTNTAERNAELERQMEELAEAVPDPKDVYKIRSH